MPRKLRMLTLPAIHNDDTLVALTPDQKAVAAREVQNAYGAFHHLNDLVKRDVLTVAMRNATLACAASYLKDLGSCLGHDADIRAEREHDLKTIRDLNEEVDSLEKLLAESAPIEGMEAKLASLGDSLSSWWKGLGFSLCDISAMIGWKRATVKAELSTHLCWSISRYSKTPVSDIEADRLTVEKLIASGLDIHSEDSTNHSVIDSEASRDWIWEKIGTRLPSARLWKWEGYTLNDQDQPGAQQITKVHVSFDFADLVSFANQSEAS